MRILKTLAAAAMAAVCVVAMGPVGPAATKTDTIVVDDDGVQCPDAGFATISDALTAARRGDTVQVCPGVYSEQVRIDRPLTLVGSPETIDTLDCFDPAPSQPGDLDPTTYAVLARPAGAKGDLLTVASRGVTLSGLVLEGAVTAGEPSDSVYDAAVHLLSGTAGARVEDNLLRHNSLGIDLGSDGRGTTRVDHNCLRENEFATSPQRQDFVGGVVEDNQTFRQASIGYEVGDRFGSQKSTYADNVSREDGWSFYVSNSSKVSIADNDLEPVTIGVALRSGNRNIQVTGNRIVGGTSLGVSFSPSPSPSPGPTSERALVAGNEISGFGRPSAPGFGIAIGSNAAGEPSIDGVRVIDNVVSDNDFGISVQLNNPGIRVRGNTSVDNRQVGIRALFLIGTASSARFVHNVMLRNGSPAVATSADALDNNRVMNTWTGNVCERDIPADTICRR